MMYDLAIIGGGPAGAAGGVYAARKKLKTILITDEWGGQSTDSLEIQNWIGTTKISGVEFAKMLKGHVGAYAGDSVTVAEGTPATGLAKRQESGFTVTTGKKTYDAATVLVAVGAQRKKLTIPGAEEFENKGVVYCASCDGPLFAGMDTVVVGGGNAGFETAAQLLAYAKSVTLLHRSEFKADPVTVDAVLSHENMTALPWSEPTEISGDAFVNKVAYKNNKTGKSGMLDASGVFVEIGLVPNTGFTKDLLEHDEINRIKVNCKNQQTSVEGVWAAGDCTNELYHQNNIAAGDAVKALEDIYNYLKAR